jgi:hypothetical protein
LRFKGEKKMEKVNVRLEARHNSFKEYEFIFENDFDYDTIFSKIIKDAKENDYLKDLFIYEYNSYDYVELLNYLDIDNKNYDGIDRLMDEYSFYYFDLDNEGVYLIDLDYFKIEVKGEN